MAEIKIKICDRCKREIKCGNKQHTGSDTVVLTDSKSSIKIRTWDLCCECMNELFEFMNGLETTEVGYNKCGDCKYYVDGSAMKNFCKHNLCSVDAEDRHCYMFTRKE